MSAASSKTKSDAPTPRQNQITDAALEVLGESGARGLTHRAVDKKAGLPEGSTSNLFRSRDALIEATMDRHVAREVEIIQAVRAVGPRGALTIPQAASLLEKALEEFASPKNEYLTAVRFEIYLEVRRRPELRSRLSAVPAAIAQAMDDLLASTSITPTPERTMAALSFLEGMMVEMTFRPMVDMIFRPEAAISAKEREAQIQTFLESLG